MITYNHAKYIEEAINGVLIQKTDFDIELVISNDNSTDNTDSIIKSVIEEKDHNKIIKYFKLIINNFLKITHFKFKF